MIGWVNVFFRPYAEAQGSEEPFLGSSATQIELTVAPNLFLRLLPKVRYILLSDCSPSRLPSFPLTPPIFPTFSRTVWPAQEAVGSCSPDFLCELALQVTLTMTSHQRLSAEALKRGMD